MKVGLVQYLNALPFHLFLDSSKWDLTFAHPTTLNTLLSEGKLDCALTSSVEYLSGNYQLLPFGIMAKKEVLSVNLHVKGAPCNDTRIALTKASATSVALLKVLCHHFWKISPQFVAENEPHDAKLFIGDEALLNIHLQGYKRIDLGHEWHKHTQLPFVFALMTVRKEVNKKELVDFSNAINDSLASAKMYPEKVVQKAHSLSNLPLDLLREYYNLLHYNLDEKDLEGLKLFSSCIKSLIPKQSNRCLQPSLQTTTEPTNCSHSGSIKNGTKPS